MTPSVPDQNDANQQLRIVHIFRSPVGGIFRHVRDLVGAQIKTGHEVGIICDNNTGGSFEEEMFEKLEPQLALGLQRFSMARSLGLSDISATRTVLNILQQMSPDVIHAHGAKGGAYARLTGAQLVRTGRKVVCLYTPHGGSMHYDAASLKGRVFFRLERMMQRWTDRLLFVSAYERDAYFSKVGRPSCPHSLIHNGIDEAEFIALETIAKPADFLFIGMMRDLKGVDLFIQALERLPDLTGANVSAHLVGDGPDLERYKNMASETDGRVTIEFHAPMPAREAFPLARCVVVPSRAESMPYLVLEALAAQRPLIATRVGGIPEIYHGIEDVLVEPDNVNVLSTAMHNWLKDSTTLPASDVMAGHIKQEFSVATMARRVNDAYQICLCQSPGTTYN